MYAIYSKKFNDMTRHRSLNFLIDIQVLSYLMVKKIAIYQLDICSKIKIDHLQQVLSYLTAHVM